MKSRHGLAAIASLGIALQWGLAQDADTAAKLYAANSKSIFLIVLKSPSGEIVGQATGFAIDRNRIVTNEHVVRAGKPYLDLGAVRIGLTVVSTDSTNDLAVLRPEGELAAPALKLASVQPLPGTAIFTIGNPQGLEKSISTGVVAGVRTTNSRELLQISAPISHGSSGGPVFSANGEVVGVTVGMLDGGQNLNFAVPTAALLRLLRGELAKADVPSLLAKADDLSAKRWQEAYSEAPDSPYQQLDKQVENVLSEALSLSGSNAPELALVADKALNLGSSLSLTASERLVEATPTAPAYVTLAKSLKVASSAETVDGIIPPSSATLKNAEEAIRAAFRTTKQPTIDMYAVLADILEDRALTTEARAAFVKTYDLAKTHSDGSNVLGSLRGLVRTSFTLKAYTESDRYFQMLVNTGKATAFDWDGQAARLFQRREFRAAGDSYEQAAQMPLLWNDWCLAAKSYLGESGAEDKVLEASRACIEKGQGQKDSDASLADAHNFIAVTLNGRGVYDEALSHAREAIAINPQNPFYQNNLASAFNGLRRFQEGINAAAARRA